eukprot:gene1613-16072_t
MAVAGDINSKTETLTGENYHNWKFQMKMYLIGKDLWEIVTGIVRDRICTRTANIKEERKSGLGMQRDFHDFDTTVLSKSDHICIEFDDEISPDVDGNVIEEVNHEVNHNILPVGATYEENFMREVANLQGARTHSSAKLAEKVNEENENYDLLIVSNSNVMINAEKKPGNTGNTEQLRHS